MNNESQEIFLLLLTIVVIAAVIYISATSPSKEEFIELHWKIYKVNFSHKAQVNCKLNPCSISGVYNFGNVTFDKKNYKIVLVDLWKDRLYDAMCIDINDNNVFCEKGEGPFRERNSFLIDSNSFNIISLEEKNFAIANYPRAVNVSNFTVGFVVKSFHSKNMDFNVSMFVNETMKKSEVLTLTPGQELDLEYPVFLQKEGLYKVGITVTSLATDQQALIDFWVRYSI